MKKYVFNAVVSYYFTFFNSFNVIYHKYLKKFDSEAQNVFIAQKYLYQKLISAIRSNNKP